MPGPPNLRPAVSWPCIPSRDTTWSLQRVQVAESGRDASAATWPRTVARAPPGTALAPFGHAPNTVSPSIPQPNLGHWARRRRYLPGPEKCTIPQVPVPQPRRGLAREMQKKRKQARGRAGPAWRLPRNSHLRFGRAGRAGSEVWGPTAAPARPGAPLTRKAAAPLAVPAAPLQNEVAAALLSHPQLQGVLQQHLLGLEPHRSGPATPAGPGSHRPGHRPRRPLGRRRQRGQQPARAGGQSVQGARRAQLAPRSPRTGPAHKPAPAPPTNPPRTLPQTRPGPAHKPSQDPPTDPPTATPTHRACSGFPSLCGSSAQFRSGGRKSSPYCQVPLCCPPRSRGAPGPLSLFCPS